MVKLIVLYGKPTDPAAFDKYYAETHIPLAQKIPNVKRLEASRVTGTPEGGEAPYHVVAELGFEDLASLQEALGSPEGQAAGADIANFATGGATLLVAEDL